MPIPDLLPVWFLEMTAPLVGLAWLVVLATPVICTLYFAISALSSAVRSD